MDLTKISGQIEHNFDEKLTRNLHGLRRLYHDQREIQRILKKNNPAVYEIFIKKQGKLNYSITIINPGNIGVEYHMTHGYKHKQPTTALCVLVSGKGKLLIHDKTTEIIDLKQNKPVTIPKGSAHRLINTGKTRLKVLTVYNSKSEYDPFHKFETKVFAK